jgi:hypothetical protein
MAGLDLLLHHLSDGDNFASTCMDVLHLAGHVLAGDEISVSCGALT